MWIASQWSERAVWLLCISSQGCKALLASCLYPEPGDWQACENVQFSIGWWKADTMNKFRTNNSDHFFLGKKKIRKNPNLASKFPECPRRGGREERQRFQFAVLCCCIYNIKSPSRNYGLKTPRFKAIFSYLVRYLTVLFSREYSFSYTKSSNSQRYVFHRSRFTCNQHGCIC